MELTASPVFDQLFAAGSADVLVGNHRVDEPPTEGGRWPVTVVTMPDEERAARFGEWTEQIVRLAGPGHFLTGRPDAVHLTVRALEAYREAASPADPETAGWTAAIERTAARFVGQSPLQLAHTGFTLTSGSVMAQLEPMDDRPWQLMRALEEELGEQAWYEAGQPRDIWYANLVHFAAPIADRAALVSWVEQRRRITPEPVVIDNLSLVRSRYREWSTADGSTERAMMPEVWHRSELG